jgi:5-methylthioadenosine/S-adenosylhomocysteine deaminase
VQANDASAFPAEAAFRAATLGGAKALNLSKMIGSLEIGKQADMIAVSCDAIGMNPMFDPVSHLVYVASRADVIHTWVAGNACVIDRALARNAHQSVTDARLQMAEFSDRVSTLRRA